MRKLHWLGLGLVAVGLAAAGAFTARQHSLDGAHAAAMPAEGNSFTALIKEAAKEIQLPDDEATEPDSEAIAAPPPAEKPLSLFPEGKLEGAKARICYFSFNNAREYQTTRNFVGQLNAHSPIQIEVLEFVRDDDDVEDALLSGMRSGQHCDGVVLSGHHRGKFWGDRSSGSLKAGFLEEQACNVRNSPWFSQVKAVWLEGCNTGKADLYNREVDSDEKVHGSPLGYIRRHLNFAELDDSLDDMNDVFEENLNEDNIAKEYMRIFPYATVFGWTDIAPGEKAGSHYSFPYHVAQIVRAVDEDPRYFQNPMHGKLTPDAARRYSETLYAMLTRDTYGNNDGRPETLSNEDTFIQAWKDHGYGAKYKYAFDNPSLTGYRSLVMHDNEILRQTTAMRCVLMQENDESESAGATVNYLVRNESITPIASQLLLALAQASPGLRGKIAESESLRRYLNHAKNAGGFAEFRRGEAATLLDALGDRSDPEKVAEQATDQEHDNESGRAQTEQSGASSTN